MLLLCAEAKCPLEDMNDRGELPVHLAARAGHTDVVRALHKRGCDIERPSGETDGTQLHRSSLTSFLEKQALLKDIENCTQCPELTRTTTTQKKAKINPMTPAHMAAEFSHAELLF